MKRLLVVSPHFPPANAPDMHRVRMSAPFLADFGWTAHVLAVDAACQEHPLDPALTRSLPDDLPVTRVRALPLRATRRVGIGNVGLRALPYLYAAGRRILAREQPDLVFFSTTIFPAMTLGRLWKRRFGVPYVVDMQDPWFTTYYEENAGVRRPPKYALAHRLDSLMEPWTLREVDGIVAVSEPYTNTLRARYPWIDQPSCLTLPFGAATRDFEIVPTLDVENRVFTPGDGVIHGVYVGRGGDDMAPALRVLFRAFAEGLARTPQVYERIRLHFVGTDYAPQERARKTIEPIARECGVAGHIVEQTGRIPYFETLRVLQDADFLLVIGSDDPHYTASKIYPYVLARRPVVAVLHEASSAAAMLRKFRAGVVATFGSGEADARLADIRADTEVRPYAVAADRCVGAVTGLCDRWTALLDRLPCEPDIDWAEFEPYTAREMTRRQCAFFDQIVSRRRPS